QSTVAATRSLCASIFSWRSGSGAGGTHLRLARMSSSLAIGQTLLLCPRRDVLPPLGAVERRVVVLGDEPNSPGELLPPLRRVLPDALPERRTRARRILRRRDVDEDGEPQHSAVDPVKSDRLE